MEIVSDDNTSEILMFKVLVLGEPGVGKTSFTHRLIDGEFSEGYKTTIGVEFGAMHFKWDEVTEIDIQLWDLAGQERFGSQTNVYFRDAVGAIIMYDVTDGRSLANVVKWKELLDAKVNVRGQSYVPPAILVANKIDRVCQKSDEFDKAELLATAKRLGFVAGTACSIKHGYGLKTTLDFLTREMVRRYRDNSDLAHIIDSQIVDLVMTEQKPQQDKKWSMC